MEPLIIHPKKYDMKQRKIMRTTAIFRCIVTLKSGARKIIRMTIDKVAKFVYLFRSQQKNPFNNESYLFGLCEDEYLLMASVEGAKFINERTGEEFLSL